MVAICSLILPLRSTGLLSTGLCCRLSKYADESGGILDGGAIDDATGDDDIDGEGGVFALSCAAIDAEDDNAGVGATTAGVDAAVVVDVVAAADGAAAAGAGGIDAAECPFVVAGVEGPAVADPDAPFVLEFATAAAYRIGGNAGLEPAVPGAPDRGSPDLSACDMGWAAKLGAGGNIGGGTFDESSVASV